MTIELNWFLSLSQLQSIIKIDIKFFSLPTYRSLIIDSLSYSYL